MCTNRLKIFFLVVGFMIVSSILKIGNAQAANGGCPGDQYLSLTVNTGGTVGVNGTPYPAAANSYSIKLNGSTTVSIDPNVYAGAGPDLSLGFSAASFVGYADTTKTIYLDGSSDVSIQAVFTAASNDPRFKTTILANGGMTIQAPVLATGQKLSRSDQVVVVKSPDASAPGKPDFKFVKGDSTSFTLKIVPPSSGAGVASYVIESFVPDPSAIRPDGKNEDIGQAFSAFASGLVTATRPIPANALPADKTYHLTGLTSDADYCFRVKAIASNGHESLPSQARCGKTPVAIA